MKRKLSILYLVAFAASGLCQVRAEAPEWWQTRGVLTGDVANDYAPANQGQLKSIATKAYEQLAQQYPGSENDVIAGVVGGFSMADNNYSSLNLGQLKAVAQPFYDRLIQLGLTNAYPWVSATTPADDYAMANIGQVKYLFSFSLASSVEDLWIFHTDATGGTIEEVGVAASLSVLKDGGFGSSQFSPSGWTRHTSGGEAGALITTDAGRSGKGLWGYTGAGRDAANRWNGTCQEFPAAPGDTFKGTANVRQPSSQYGAWVPNSRIWIRVEYLKSNGDPVAYGVFNSEYITTENANWTPCAVGPCVAPPETARVRFSLRVMKPHNKDGISTANHDDCTFFRLANRDSSWAGDGEETPEGGTCYLSSVMDQSGWRVNYGQSLDLSAYSSGYLKFWLKSTGRTRIGVEDSAGRTSSQVVAAKAGWTEVSIPVSSFGAVDLGTIRRPFTIRSEETTPSRFLVDAVRWTAMP